MLIKITDFDDALLEQLKQRTFQTTGSKAVLKATQDYLVTLKENEHLIREVADLQRRLALAEQVIEGARSAATLLLEKTGQTAMEI